jgi:hypothetical protein
MNILYILILLTTISFANSIKKIKADIIAVAINGQNFSITLKSDETGCAEYANWWEILNKNGKLLYRRILFHSHPNEQPFTRDGGPIQIFKNEKVYIRAHMNNVGYSGNVFFGSPKDGFKEIINPPIFSKSIEAQSPQPGKCWF